MCLKMLTDVCLFSSHVWFIMSAWNAVGCVNQMSVETISAPMYRYICDALSAVIVTALCNGECSGSGFGLCLRDASGIECQQTGILLRMSFWRPVYSVKHVGSVVQDEPKNVALYFCPYLRQLLIDFQNFFTGTLCGQFAIT